MARGGQFTADNLLAAYGLPTVEQLTGQCRKHVIEAPFGLNDTRIWVHPAVVEPFNALREMAMAEGFDLRIVSGFRDYERQLTIWNAKAAGAKDVLDADEERINILALRPAARVFAILLWSAIPGCSRHHWGTDIDIVDVASIPAAYRVKLSPSEYAPSGPFARMHLWIDRQIQRDDACNFFRPYPENSAGVGYEPWHLSWAPLAQHCQRVLNKDLLLERVLIRRPALAEYIEEQFDRIYRDYVVVPPQRYPAEIS